MRGRPLPRPGTSLSPRIDVNIIYQVDHDGVIGVIESPDEIDPLRPLAEQMQVKIGVNDSARSLHPDEFTARARLVILELRNYLRDEWGIEESTLEPFADVQ